MPKRFARLVLHIGTEKTGTTTLQEFLSMNRKALSAHGILYPRSLGKSNHIRMAACVETAPWKLGRKFFGVEGAAAHRRFREQVAEELRTEIEESDCSRCIISNEHLHSHVSLEQIRKLADFLDPFADDVRVLVYFRRQDLLAVSRYSTALKAGWLPKTPFAPGSAQGEQRYYFDHWQIYSGWSKVFGADHMDVRIFSPQHFVSGDLISDFCSAADIPGAADFERPGPKNESLGSDAESLVRELNVRMEKGALTLRPPERQRLIAKITTTYSSKPALPVRAEARAFLNQFSESNAKLAGILGLAAKSPFDDDVSLYPEALDPEQIRLRRLWARYELTRLLRTDAARAAADKRLA